MFADSKISNWFASPLGQWLLQNEQRQCETLLPAGYYPYSLQLGLPIIDLAENIETGYRVTLSNGYLKQVGAGRQNQAQPTAVARAAALPFGDRSHNLIFLPHTLDFCSDPHAVLREVSQVLAPEGYAVIIGFNRLSLWGGMRWAERHRGAADERVLPRAAGAGLAGAVGVRPGRRRYAGV